MVIGKNSFFVDYYSGNLSTVNMAQSDWKRELDRMMHMLDDQLEKIDGSLQASGLSFNEELRQNVTKMIQLRYVGFYIAFLVIQMIAKLQRVPQAI